MIIHDLYPGYPGTIELSIRWTVLSGAASPTLREKIYATLLKLFWI